ncbi:MAG: ABC transporter permease [Candidatus Sumerlaeia bacterium]|nr:ABC transporter permease [Candidatus Sumerlaeia bacterium]
MGTTLRIFGREFRGYLNSPALYIFLVVFVSMCGWVLFHQSAFWTQNFARLDALFSVMPLLLLVFVPAVAMRLWAEEHKTGTVELLMTLPVREWEAVLGKYLAALLVVLLALALTAPVAAIVAGLADEKTPMDFGPVWGAYLGMAMMGAIYLAIANMVSALTKNQIVAFIMGITFCFGIFMVGAPGVLRSLPEAVVPFFAYIGLGAHLDGVIRGVVDTRTVLYTASFVAVMLFATVRILDSRRWR